MITVEFKDGSSFMPVGVRKVEIIDGELVITCFVGRLRVSRFALESVAVLRNGTS